MYLVSTLPYLQPNHQYFFLKHIQGSRNESVEFDLGRFFSYDFFEVSFVMYFLLLKVQSCNKLYEERFALKIFLFEKKNPFEIDFPF